MIRLFSIAFAAAALAGAASAQTHYSAGGVVSYERTGPGPLTGLGISINAQRGRLLVQAHLADVSLGRVTYTDTPTGSAGAQRSYPRADVRSGVDVHFVQVIARSVAATLGAGGGVVRRDDRYLGGLLGPSNARWEVDYHVSAGALVGRAGRLQGYARVLARPDANGLNRSRTQLGVLVPIR